MHVEARKGPMLLIFIHLDPNKSETKTHAILLVEYTFECFQQHLLSERVGQ